MADTLTGFRDYCRRAARTGHGSACKADPYARPSVVCTDPCLTDEQRAGFTRLADEVDAYLSRDEIAGATTDEPMFEEMTG